VFFLAARGNSSAPADSAGGCSNGRSRSRVTPESEGCATAIDTTSDKGENHGPHAAATGEQLVRPRAKAIAAVLLPLRARGRPPARQSAPDNPALQAIWHVVCAIPRGQVSTYGAVARAAGLPGRARQAGFALRMAPRELHVPWHRVVGAGGRIVFPPSSPAHREQSRRLRAEGVAVTGGRVAATAMTSLEVL
jgi:methylated-DNA-protein-cysteine methyltransferase related protein